MEIRDVDCSGWAQENAVNRMADVLYRLEEKDGVGAVAFRDLVDDVQVLRPAFGSAGVRAFNDEFNSGYFATELHLEDLFGLYVSDMDCKRATVVDTVYRGIRSFRLEIDRVYRLVKAFDEELVWDKGPLDEVVEKLRDGTIEEDEFIWFNSKINGAGGQSGRPEYVDLISRVFARLDKVMHSVGGLVVISSGIVHAKPVGDEGQGAVLHKGFLGHGFEWNRDWIK